MTHILSIEDDLDMGRTLALASRKGFAADVDLVADGLTGIEGARQERHDPIICDRRLPGVDGLRRLERSAPVAEAPFNLLREAGVGGRS